MLFLNARRLLDKNRRNVKIFMEVQGVGLDMRGRKERSTWRTVSNAWLGWIGLDGLPSIQILGGSEIVMMATVSADI